MKTLLLSLLLPVALFAQSLGDPGFIASLKPSAGGGAPSDFTTGLSLQLKADDLSLGDGDPVDTWTAAVGGNFTSSGGNRPAFQTSEYNSLPTVRFDGTDDYLTGTITADETCTLVIVYKRTGTAALTLAAYAQLEQIYIDTATAHYYQPDTAANGGSGTSIGLIAIRFNSVSSADIRAQNGTWVNFDPLDTYSIDTDFILGAALSVGPATPIAADICEVRLYNSALSDANINSAGAYLAYKWGFAWTNL